MGGRPGKAIELHKLEGTYREDRHGDRMELPPMANIPEPPEELSEKAVRYWNKYCVILKDMNMLKEADLDQLKALCVYESVKERMSEKLAACERQGLTRDTLVAQKIYSEAAKSALVIAKEFGFTPQARTKIKVEKPKDQSPFDGI